MDLWISRDAERSVGAAVAVLALVIPWEFTYVDRAGGLLLLRFPVFEVRFVGGLGGFQPIRTPLYLYNRQLANQGVADLLLMYQLWMAGAVILGLAVVLGIAIYVTDPLDGGPNPTRILGGLLLGGGACFVGAWYFLATSGFRGLDIPLGAILVPALGAALLLAERR
jgi:hypothetical protein